MLDRHSGACTISEKCFGAPRDILELLHFLKNVLELQALQKSFRKSYRNISKLEKHSGASALSVKCIGTLGTQGVFQESYKNKDSSIKNGTGFFEYYVKTIIGT